MNRFLIFLDVGDEEIIREAELIAHDVLLDNSEIVDAESALKFILATHGLTAHITRPDYSE